MLRGVCQCPASNRILHGQSCGGQASFLLLVVQAVVEAVAVAVAAVVVSAVVQAVVEAVAVAVAAVVVSAGVVMQADREMTKLQKNDHGSGCTNCGLKLPAIAARKNLEMLASQIQPISIVVYLPLATYGIVW